MHTYMFRANGGRFIINVEYSGLGYAYPRVFIENAAKCEFHNADITLGCIFWQFSKDFMSWLDGTETVGADFNEVCNDIRIDPSVLSELIAEIQECPFELVS